MMATLYAQRPFYRPITKDNGQYNGPEVYCFLSTYSKEFLNFTIQLYICIYVYARIMHYYREYFKTNTPKPLFSLWTDFPQSYSMLLINPSCWFKFFSKPGWLGSLWVTVGRIGPEEI